MRFVFMAMAAIAVTMPMAHAQAPAAPPAATPVPEAMPFDIPYGTPIKMDDAHKAMIAAAAEAKKHNWKMAISVVDPSGNLVAHATMDDTQYGSIEVSQAKARTSAMFRRPTSVFQTAINTGGAPSAMTIVNLIRGAAAEGGFPIVIDGKLIGAIGVSGGLSTQDAMCAKAGLEALGAK